MRIARVIAKVVLSMKIKEMLPASYLVVRTCNRGTLTGANEGNAEELVLYDDLGASEGDLVGLVEGAEAIAPFAPLKPPFDAYNACILDEVVFKPILT